jgi:bifunctional DNA-binding transcriptional regulator/antitoxin component of YhaV-PrlF toxin-antitoxin module
MHTATLTAKCQLVLPAPLRRVHGLKARARVVFEDRPEGILVRPASSDGLPEYVPPMKNIRRTPAEIELGNSFGHTFGDPE